VKRDLMSSMIKRSIEAKLDIRALIRIFNNIYIIIKNIRNKRSDFQMKSSLVFVNTLRGNATLEYSKNLKSFF